MKSTLALAKKLAEQLITNKEFCYATLSDSNIYDLEITVKDDDNNEIYDIVYSPQTDATYWVFYKSGLVFRCDNLETVMNFINIKRPEKNGGHYALTK